MSVQPIKRNGIKKTRKATIKKNKKTNRYKSKRQHPEYGASKLEDKFAKEFLDKLGVTYERQFLAEDIHRYYDFIVNGRILIEVDGTYFHSFGLMYEEMNPMQKRNRRVDIIKNEWAIEHGYILVRIWEHDINNNPQKVMKILEQAIGLNTEKTRILENKKKRH